MYVLYCYSNLASKRDASLLHQLLMDMLSMGVDLMNPNQGGLESLRTSRDCLP